MTPMSLYNVQSNRQLKNPERKKSPHCPDAAVSLRIPIIESPFRVNELGFEREEGISIRSITPRCQASTSEGTQQH
jgi:hypothetical protein